ncbi:hypothetical protein ACFW04_003327 [Cataglyphis niger]
MKNSGGTGEKVIAKRSQTTRPAYQLYLLQWETAAGRAFGAFPKLNSTVAGGFRAARLQARVVTNGQNFTSIDLPRPGTADPSLAAAVAECATALFTFSLASPLLLVCRFVLRSRTEKSGYLTVCLTFFPLFFVRGKPDRHFSRRVVHESPRSLSANFNAPRNRAPKNARIRDLDFVRAVLDPRTWIMEICNAWL